MRRQSTINPQSFMLLTKAPDAFESNRNTSNLQFDQHGLVDKMAQLIQQSSSFDDIEIVEQQQVSRTEFKNVSYLTLPQALQQFIQARPSDELLLSDDDYIINRKVDIYKNLQAEIKKIDNLIPSGIEAADSAFQKQKQYKKMIQHFKKIFPKNSDEKVESMLAPFLTIYKTQLEAYLKQLMSDKLIMRHNTMGSKAIGSLGSRPRSSRIVQVSASDEKQILEVQRKDLYQLELLVLKIVIAVERINYYTMGLILPRDQNLKQIPFFETQKDPLYDFQSCLQICNLIKTMIERQEQIERQLSPYTAIVTMRSTQYQQPGKSFYFDRRNEQEFKEKCAFREKFNSEESKKRCKDIWQEFADVGTEGSVEELKVNLHVKVMNLTHTFESLGCKVTFQLFCQPGKPHSPQVHLTDPKNAWLFTEVKFGETLLKDDLVLVIKVFSQHHLQIKSHQQKVNPKSSLPMTLTFLKAYSIINVSDVFFEHHMTEGRPLDPFEVRFYQIDNEWTLDLDYNTILNKMRYNEIKSVLDEQLTAMLDLKLQLTLLSCISRQQLALRLDQAQIVRSKTYWHSMVQTVHHLPQKDPQFIFASEMEQLNLRQLQRVHQQADTINDLRVQINFLQIKEKNQNTPKIFRIQVYLLQKTSQSSTVNFVELRKDQETFQTPIATIKKGLVHLHSELNVRVPITLKTKDLQNYSLVFFVYSPWDTQKVHIQITEAMVEQEPSRYTFMPLCFAKIPLLSAQNVILGGSNKDILVPLYKYTPKKYIYEQLDSDTEALGGSLLSVTPQLTSQQYSAQDYICAIIEPDLGKEPNIPQVLKIVQDQLSDNDLLIYFTRIVYALLHLYNITKPEQSQGVLSSVIAILDRFQSKQLKVYQPLIVSFEERWRGDRDSDRKLLLKLQQTLQKIPESVAELFDKPIDLILSPEIRVVQQMLSHMPAVLSLLSRLFSREFQTLYASIREKITTYFRKWMEKDLCVYRPDIVEGTIGVQIPVLSSRPAVIVLQLEEDIATLVKNYKVNSTIKEESDDDIKLDNGFSEDEDDFQFVSERPSIFKRETFHNKGDGSSDLDAQLKQLQQLVAELKTFQLQFCNGIKSALLNINRYLHEDQVMKPDDPTFQTKVKKIIEIQKTENPAQKKELDRLILETFTPYSLYIKSFSEKAQNRLGSYHLRRKDLKRVFWSTLQQNLQVCINFIDKKFVLALFDDKLLLHRLDPVLDQIVETIIPDFDTCTKTYGAFYKSQQEHIRSTASSIEQTNQQRDSFDKLVKDATKKYKQLREDEQLEIENQVKAKVLMLSDLLASDTFTMLPTDPPTIQTIITPNPYEESIQEILATKIALSVYHHLRQYKNQYKEDQGRSNTDERIKDTTQSELQYLFTFKMSVFEKKYFQQKATDQGYDEKNQNLNLINQVTLPRNSTLVSTFDDQDLLGGLAKIQPPVLDPVLEETKDQPKKKVNPLDKSMRLGFGLGAKKDLINFKDRQDFLFLQFEPKSSERRMCFFLNEMEDALSKYWELKDNAQHLSIPELDAMKKTYNSLFSVLSLQQLAGLTPTAFLHLYQKRPGCLDRLVKQVKVTTTSLEFGLDEFFFHIKKLQVVEVFCKNVIEMLCDQNNKKYISELQDKYTYKSIVSQVWVLQLTLLCEQAQVLYDYVEKGSVYKKDETSHQKSVADFTQRLKQHQAAQFHLWSNYKDMDDMILPEESTDLYTGIQGRVIKILQVDLADQTLTSIDKDKLSNVLKPLAQMFVQIDELTYRTSGELSHRVFASIENLIKEFVVSGQQTDKNQQVQRAKKKQICDSFVEEYRCSTVLLNSRDGTFAQKIKERVHEITRINSLYQQAIQYEKVANQEGNLLAQLISYYELMQLLQEKNLSVSFQNNIKVKYKTMIDNINSVLLEAYKKDLKKMETDPDHICQKQPSQYENQMKEVIAFMHVEDYYTYKAALNLGLLNNCTNHQNIKALETIIDQAVALLVPQNSAKSSNPNQFFDKALELLSDKRALQETNYDFKNVITTLDNQISHYKMYAQFEEKQIYCNYYRIKVESFLPAEMQVKDRYFVYRTPSGYNQEFIKHDIGCLLNHNTTVQYSKDCEVKPLQPLTSEVRQKFNIQPNTKNLSETPEEVTMMCPPKFRNYFKQNFKKQFYVEQCPSLDPAGFEEEYVITIYEVKKTFPTMTMLQQVFRTFERKVPRVKIELYQIKVILTEIQNVLRKQDNASRDFDEIGGGAKSEAKTLDALIQKYITNDDVGGGLPKMLDLFFSESLAEAFNKLTNIELKRAYLELFKGIEKWLSELCKAVEIFSTVGHNVELTKLAEERLEDRQKVLMERRRLYKLHELQENF